MTVTLNLRPELEAGMTVEEYLVSVVESAVLAARLNTLSAEERAKAFEAWSAGQRPTAPLSDYAVSRDAMYEDRDR
jgi:hypothetical protein